MCGIGFIAFVSPEALLLAEVGSGGVSGVFLESALALAVAILSGLLSKFLIKLIEKTGIQLDEAKQFAVEEATRKAIKFAAEWAAKRAKLQSLSSKGSEKLEVAAKRLLEKIPDISKEEAKKLVEESLADVEEGAASFLARAADAASPDPK